MRAGCVLACATLVACGDGSGPNDSGTDASDASDVTVDVDAGPRATTIIVLNAGGTSLVTFPIDATGDVAPTASVTVSGGNGLAVDAQHFLYVTTPTAILVFAPGSTTPTRTIAGPSVLAATDVFASIAVAPDGTIFAAAQLPTGAARDPKIEVFAPGASGDVAPIRTLTGPTTTMNAVLSASYFFTGIAVADASEHVLFFSPNASGDVAPKRTLNIGPGVVEHTWFNGIGALYVARFEVSTSTVLAYVAGAQANAVPLITFAGASTKLTAAAGVATDDFSNVFVTNADPNGASVLVFDSNATGDVAPIRTISGPTTTLSGNASQGPMPLVVY